MIDRFLELPRPAQAGLAILGGGTLLGALGTIFDARVVGIVLLGLLAIVLLLAVYGWALRRWRRRRARPFERELRDSGGAVPGSVSDVADRARMADMRKKFDKGVTVFREHGKEIYSLPWYVVIGEPGSGKTEAIRRCGIGFPPGLQDELQGTGGTINMDWWFTDHAVILDTAGRLSFGQEHSADSREWLEFLKLLRKNRPNCPINGLLIAIPAESLIEDGAETIEQKAGHLARQLDLIQRTLGVRFPVFVVVTKADFLTGFRPFFQDLRDPQLQHQMLGWSNPAGLDDPFDASRLDQYLRQVHGNLMKRRLGVLRETEPPADPGARRVDEVDELYAFPHALDRITSRLRRYLELIFLSGEWSAKPLFLRGIYFTSSMQQGKQLDEELAEALGLDVEALEETAWGESRAFFLRDLFMEKIFRERGLVTNATNTRARMRRRRTVVAGAGLAAALLLAALVVTAMWGFQRRIAPHRDFWVEARDVYVNRRDVFRVVDRGENGSWVYQGDLPLGESTLVDMISGARARADEPFTPPLAFRLAASGGNILEDERVQACRDLYETAVAMPLVGGAAAKLDAGGIDYGQDPAVGALGQLVALRAADPGGASFDVASLMGFLVDGPAPAGGASRIGADAARLQTVGDWIVQDGPGLSERVGRAADPALVARALGEFNRYWAQAFGAGERGSGEADRLRDLAAALRAFDEAEKALLEVEQYAAPEGGRSGDLAATTVKQAIGDWTRRYEALQAAHETLAPMIAGLEGRSLAGAWSTLRRKRLDRARSAYGRLAAAATGDPGLGIDELASPSDDGFDPSRLPSLATSLRDGWLALERTVAEAEVAMGDLAELDRLFLVGGGEGGPAPFALRFEMYLRAAATIAGGGRDGAPAFGTTAEALRGVGRDLDAASTAIGDAALRHGQATGGAQTPPGERGRRAERVARFVVDDLARARSERAVVAAFLEALGGRSADALAAEVARQSAARRSGGSEAGVEVETLPAIPLTALAAEGGVPVEREYDRHVAAGLFEDWSEVSESSAAAGHAALDPARRTIVAYAGAYVDYWTRVVLALLEIDAPDWAGFYEGVRGAVRLGSGLPAAFEALIDLCGAALRAPVDGAGAAGGFAPIVATCRRGLADLERGREFFDRHDWSGVLEGWLRLDAAGERAAATMREALEERRFRHEEYFVFEGAGSGGSGGEPSAGFVARYWSQLGLRGAELLAEVRGRQAAAALQRLAGLRGFPLGRWERGRGQLSREQIAEARGLVAAVVAGGSATDGMARTRHDNAESNLRVIRNLEPSAHDALERLFRPVADERALEDARRADTLLSALPGPGASWTVEVTVHGPQDVDYRDLAQDRWLYVRLGQGGAGGRVLCRAGTRLGTIEYPGDGLSFEFFLDDNAAKGPDNTVTLDGPWAALGLLHLSEVEGAARKWTVAVPVPDADRVRQLWLELDFRDHEAPSREAWRLGLAAP